MIDHPEILEGQRLKLILMYENVSTSHFLNFIMAIYLSAITEKYTWLIKLREEKS